MAITRAHSTSKQAICITKHFKPIHHFSIEVSGKLACFTDPISKVERTSYPAPTAGSLDYLIQRIYGHPCIRYRIDRIHILNPLKYCPIYLNERAELGNVDMTTGSIKCVESTTALQRMTTFIEDVKYVVDFTMFYDKNYYHRTGGKVKPGENANKHIATLERRIKKGQSEYLPCFGLSECVADFGPVPIRYQECKTINMVYNSLYKIVHLDDYTSMTAFARIEIRNGVIDFSKVRIAVGEGTYSQDEFINIDWGCNAII